MTTTIEKRAFGVFISTTSITNETLRVKVGSLNARHIEIFDQSFARTTYIRDQHLSTTEVVANLLDADCRPAWDVDEETHLTSGQSIEIGPVWCRLKITRE